MNANSYKVITFPIVLMIVIFFVWASFMEIGEFVRGMGKIIPSRDVQRVQHLEGGIIADIYLKEGEVVKKDQPLFRITNSQALSDLSELRTNLNAAEASKARIEAELSGSEYVQFRQDIIDSVPSIVESERKLFNERRIKMAQDIDIANSRLSIARQDLEERRGRLKNMIIEREYAREVRDTYEALAKSGAGSKTEYIRAVRDYQSIVTEIDDLNNQIPSSEKSVQEAQSQLSAVTSSYNLESQEALSKVLLEIQTTQDKIKAADDRVKRNQVLSPVNGIVQTNYFNTIGGIVRNGDVLAEIIPIDDVLVVEARIRPEDRARVWNGQDVNVSITAYDHSIYGQIHGNITEVSADTFLEERTGAEYYTIKVRADDIGFGEDKPLYPGMVAEINVVAGKRTVLKYITKPILRVFQTAFREP